MYMVLKIIEPTHTRTHSSPRTCGTLVLTDATTSRPPLLPLLPLLGGVLVCARARGVGPGELR